MFEIALCANQWVDVADPDVRRRFIRQGRRVDLGRAGERPTGARPTILLGGGIEGFRRNRGSGGADFADGLEGRPLPFSGPTARVGV